MQADRAIELLEQQREVAASMQQQNRDSPQFKKWQRDTEVAIEKIFGVDTRNIHDFKNIRYISFKALGSGERSDVHEAYVHGLAEAHAILASMIDEIRKFPPSHGEDEIGAPDVLNLIERLCLRFHPAARALQNRYNERETLQINDEYDVQDLLHAFLRLHFDDIRLEESGPSHAGSSPRMDFLLKDERIVVEVKKTRPSLNAKKLGEELIIDCARYERHPDCDTLVCFVYDPEARIGNPTGMERDLESHTGRLKVRVIIAPK